LLTTPETAPLIVAVTTDNGIVELFPFADKRQIYELQSSNSPLSFSIASSFESLPAEARHDSFGSLVPIRGSPLQVR
jgi:hypothetical protein